MKWWKDTNRLQCAYCHKVTAGRLPRVGQHTGDGTFYYPRRHNGPDGKPCPGNLMEAVAVSAGKRAPEAAR